MLKFELQKILGRPSGKAALVVLAAAILLTTFFACNVRYVDQAGQTHTGPAAARQLRQQQKTWAGVLDEAMLRQVLQTHQEVQASPEASRRTSPGKTWPTTRCRPMRSSGTSSTRPTPLTSRPTTTSP